MARLVVAFVAVDLPIETSVVVSRPILEIVMYGMCHWTLDIGHWILFDVMKS